MKTPVRDQVNNLPAEEYFTLMSELMKRNPPSAADAPELERIAPLGIVPGKSFDPAPMDKRWSKRLPEVSNKRIMLHFLSRDGDMKRQNGWAYTVKAGNYGTNYLQRALVTAIGLGANRPQDAVYPTSLKPSLVESYDGSKSTSYAFRPASFHRSRASGHLPCMTRTCSSSQTRSIVTR